MLSFPEGAPIALTEDGSELDKCSFRQEGFLTEFPTKVRFDVIGDIAVIRDSGDGLERAAAETILRKNRRVRVVLAKTGPVEGAYRLPRLRLVAGERRTVTVHRENGCIFYIDLVGVHFSPRLANERRLVAESVRSGELVLNMFGGLGTFSVEIAKENPLTVVFSIDINPEAARLCLRNVLVNRLKGKVVTVLGDAKETSNTLFLGRMDRVLLPLPEKSHEYLDVAVSTLRHSGTIHYYDFVSADERRSCVYVALDKVIGSPIEGDLLLRGGRVVKSVAPRRYLVSLELQVRKTANLA